MSLEFYLIATLALLIFGISKGGFGAGIGLIASPLIALATNDIRLAIGIILPVLILMDIVGLFFYKPTTWSRKNLLILIPSSLAGVVLAGFFIGSLDADSLRLVLGIIAFSFALWQLTQDYIHRKLQKAMLFPNWVGCACGLLSGVSSSLAHAGAPPTNVYLLPQKLPKDTYIGTVVVVFFCINLAKLPSYLLTELITWESFRLSLVLLPIAPIGMWLGVKLKDRVKSDRLYYGICNICLLLTGLKLLFG